MDHITIDEAARFVSIRTLDKTDLSLAARVNSHILRCDRCRELIRSAMGEHGEKEISKCDGMSISKTNNVAETENDEEDMCVKA